MNIRIYDDIDRSITFEDYEMVQHEFKKICLESGISSKKIGFFGEISCPSVSDIDALVIGNNASIRKAQRKINSLVKESDYFSYCFQHNPIYILEDEVDSAKYLHTLNGARFPYSDSSEMIGKLKNDNFDHIKLLYIVWFTFLVKAASGLFTNKTISLRRLLLIDKNIEYSFNFFVDEINCHPDVSLISSSDLRKKIVYTQTLESRDEAEIIEIFHERFLATCNIFDRYCEKFQGNSINQRNDPRFLFSAKPFFILKAQSTKIHILGRFSIIETNPFAFHLGNQYLRGFDSSSNTLDFYIKTLLRNSAVHIKSGIRKPFITPFGLPRISPIYFGFRYLNSIL